MPKKVYSKSVSLFGEQDMDMISKYQLYSLNPNIKKFCVSFIYNNKAFNTLDIAYEDIKDSKLTAEIQKILTNKNNKTETKTKEAKEGQAKEGQEFEYEDSFYINAHINNGSDLLSFFDYSTYNYMYLQNLDNPPVNTYQYQIINLQKYYINKTHCQYHYYKHYSKNTQNLCKRIKKYSSTHEYYKRTQNVVKLLDLSYNKFKNLRFVGYIKRDLIHKDDFNTSIESKQPNNYIVDLTLHCKVQEVFQKTYNSTCAHVLHASNIFSLVKLLRDRVKNITEYDTILEYLSENENITFTRIMRRMRDFAETRVAHKAYNYRTFSTHFKTCYKIEPDLKEIFEQTNPIYRYLNESNPADKLEDYVLNDQKVGNSENDKGKDNEENKYKTNENNLFASETESEDKYIFKNIECIMDSYKQYFFKWNEEKSLFEFQTVELKLYYLSHLFVYEWFVKCGEGLYTGVNAPACAESDPFCQRSCDMLRVKLLFEAMTEFHCHDDIFAKYYKVAYPSTSEKNALYYYNEKELLFKSVNEQ